ncbi:MAG TPA: hypothetical protein VJN95_04940 [Gemmatimonadales bacterium]|nr:hypothetical protein [Gemmatimonadales bacterium]
MQLPHRPGQAFRDLYAWSSVHFRRIGFTLVLASSSLPGCDRPAPPPTVVIGDSSGIPILRLDRSPNEIAKDYFRSKTLRPTFDFPGPLGTEGRIGGALEQSSDRFVYLDRLTRHLVTVDSTGSLVGNVGFQAPTAWPGEFPVAFVSVGRRLVIWNDDSVNALIVTDSAGSALLALPRPVAGDWHAFVYRHPVSLEDAPIQQNAEALDRRMVPFDDSSFLLLLQPNERQLFRQGIAVRLDTVRAQALRVFLTPPRTIVQATLPGFTVIHLAPNSSESQRFATPLFAARPLVAAGRDWYAVTSGRQSGIEVFHPDGRPLARIEWPHRILSVTDKDRSNATDWWIRYTNEVDAGFHGRWAAASRQDRSEWKAQEQDALSFSESFAEIAGMLGDRSCLWLQGYSSEDNPTGSSSRFLVLNLAERRIESLVVIPQGFRVWSIGPSGILASHRANGREYLTRFAHGLDACGTALPGARAAGSPM